MMFGLGIRYLMGWAMAAADGAKKEQVEWPPHPDRVFMALAAAWFETGSDISEGEALRWLEQLPAPDITASGRHVRESVTHFVPVNDTSTPFEDERNGKLAIPSGEFSIGRPRRPRAFPVAIPFSPVVFITWNQKIPEIYKNALNSICFKVTSVGHSASLVQMWLEDNPPPPNLTPVSGLAKHRLRIFGPGRLAYLEQRHNRKQVLAYAEMETRVLAAKGKERSILKGNIARQFPSGKPVSLRPEPGIWMGYDTPLPTPAPNIPESHFDSRLVILSLTGKRLPLTASLRLTEAFRGALMSSCPEPIPEWISGHALDGSPSKKPHVATLPLPFVGREHADGRLMGIAIALPRGIDPHEAGRVIEPWLRTEDGLPLKLKIFDGQWLECRAELETRESPPHSLRSETWNGPSCRWASVTPIVLDRHFKGKDKWEMAADSLKTACERIGLPRPIEVLLHPVSLIQGVPKSTEFPNMIRKNNDGQMYHTHAVIVFGEPVHGPVLIGAGRYRGYGLCRPLQQGGEVHD